MHVLYKEDQISISKFDSILKKGSPHQMVHGKLVLDDASEILLAGNNSPRRNTTAGILNQAIQYEASSFPIRIQYHGRDWSVDEFDQQMEKFYAKDSKQSRSKREWDYTLIVPKDFDAAQYGLNPSCTEIPVHQDNDLLYVDCSPSNPTRKPSIKTQLPTFSNFMSFAAGHLSGQAVKDTANDPTAKKLELAIEKQIKKDFSGLSAEDANRIVQHFAEQNRLRSALRQVQDEKVFEITANTYQRNHPEAETPPAWLAEMKEARAKLHKDPPDQLRRDRS